MEEINDDRNINNDIGIIVVVGRSVRDQRIAPCLCGIGDDMYKSRASYLLRIINT